MTSVRWAKADGSRGGGLYSTGKTRMKAGSHSTHSFACTTIVIVINIGGAVDGSGADARAADKVVAEIKAAGGEATANYDSVENGANIVKTAMVGE